jgi:hypothetical protein
LERVLGEERGEKEFASVCEGSTESLRARERERVCVCECECESSTKRATSQMRVYTVYADAEEHSDVIVCDGW